MQYPIYIEINGSMKKAGIIENGQFTYDLEYIEEIGKPISLHLPMQRKAFSTLDTEIYFGGLLPEKAARRNISEHLRISEEAYLALLERLGMECIGAVRIGEPISSSYQRLSLDDLKKLATGGRNAVSRFLTLSHLSLPGAMGKTSLYYDQGAWYQPLEGAYTNYVVKQSHGRLPHMVLNEVLCMKTARKCGVNAASVSIIKTGGLEDDSILFAAERYDRREGLRLHQEDFSQALGVSPVYKYEQKGQSYISKMFELIKEKSASPMEDMEELWRRIVFNYLIGNTDSHLKNYGLLYNADLTTVRLAPAYDVLCTLAYDNNRNRLAMRIGNATNFYDVTKEDFALAAKEIELPKEMAFEEVCRLKFMFKEALLSTAKELEEEGFAAAGELMQTILEKGGYNRI